ncbi:hypothetical protein L2E82_10728 [Cichorium intybus]|uniref:Uncharacterized protein n=1 Tax=Cichorium intybus TaxID=13427 RepID=A0ACB9GCH6_CICIN|nr:hypothetical protein L2E82_10728 [Cichorium intybus]
MVEVTIGLKNIKVRVTEVERKLFNQSKMEKETKCTIETEEEEDSEDEEFFITSDEEYQATFSDEEVEEDNGQSNVQTTSYGTVLKKQTREEKTPKEQDVSRISSDDGAKLGFSDEEDEKYDLDDEEISIVQETVPEVAFNESPVQAGDKTEGQAQVDELADAGDTPKTQKKTVENVSHSALSSCACVSKHANRD